MDRGEHGEFLRPFNKDGWLRDSMDETVADSVDTV